MNSTPSPSSPQASQPETWSLQTIGIIHSPFREKFGIPRQPGLAPHAISRLQLFSDYARPECIAGIEGFSHLWLTFVFHQTADQGWSPTVRPPRLGGNARVGVFASRSTFRPNPLGLSVVELVGVEQGPEGVALVLRGADLLDGTPVLDIKPYLPYADALPAAKSGYAPEAPAARLQVAWSADAVADANRLQLSRDFQQLTEEVLSQDPRPAYRKEAADDREYGIWLAAANIRFRVTGQTALITGIDPRP